MLGSLAEQPILSIDWDPRTLRIVHARCSRKAVRIDQVFSVPIPDTVAPGDAASLGAFIREALDQARIRTKRVVVDMPRDQVNFYTLKLPRASVNDLAGMVAFQMPRELPFPVDQAAVDFTAPAEAEQGETNDILVAAVRKSRLEVYQSVCSQAGLKLQHVGLRPNANQLAVNAMLAPTPRERVLFVDVGPATTEIDVIREGRLVFSRAADVAIPESFDDTRIEMAKEDAAGGRPLLSIAPGLPSKSSLEAIVRELMIEVTRSIEAYRTTDPSVSIDHAVIGGSCDIEEALAEAIRRQYHITAQPYNPAACFRWEADRGAAAGAFAATLGLALAQVQPAHSRFDFLHPKKSVSRAQRQIRRAPLAAAAAVLVVAAGGVWYWKFIRPEYQTRDRLTVEIADVEKTLEKQQEFAETVTLLRDFDTDQTVWLDTLYDVLSALPDNQSLVLAGMDLSEKDHSIKIPIRASQSDVVSGAVSALEGFRQTGKDRPMFKAAPGATSVKSGAKYAHESKLEIHLVEHEAATTKGTRPKRK